MTVSTGRPKPRGHGGTGGGKPTGGKPSGRGKPSGTQPKVGRPWLIRTSSISKDGWRKDVTVIGGIRITDSHERGKHIHTVGGIGERIAATKAQNELVKDTRRLVDEIEPRAEESMEAWRAKNALRAADLAKAQAAYERDDCRNLEWGAFDGSKDTIGAIPDETWNRIVLGKSSDDETQSWQPE